MSPLLTVKNSGNKPTLKRHFPFGKGLTQIFDDLLYIVVFFETKLFYIRVRPTVCNDFFNR